MANQHSMNEYGLTFYRWYAAATFGVRGKLPPGTYKRMKESWRAGECPCDWAAALA